MRKIDNTYIHLKEANFRNRYKNMKKPTVGDISVAYMDNADFIKKRYAKMAGIKSGKKVELQLGKILDAIASINAEDVVTKSITKDSEAIIKKSRELYSKMSDYNRGTKYKKDVLELQSALDDLKDFCDSLEEYNGRVLEYMTNVGVAEANLANPYGGDKALSILQTNKSGNTSFENLLRKIDIIEKKVNSFGENQKSFQNTKVEYEKLGDKKPIKRNFLDLFGGMGYQIHNIQGAIAENVGQNLARNAVQKGLIDWIKSQPSNSISVVGTGGDNDLTNKTLGITEGTSTSDISIRVEQDGTILTVLGISSKAQFREGDDKSESTTFLTSTVEGVLRRAQLLGSQHDYGFLNMLNQGIYDSRREEANIMRRYLAARAMRYALGGLGGADQVFFLQYADGIERVDKYFESLARSKNLSSLPQLSVASKGGVASGQKFYGRAEARDKNVSMDNFIDLTPEEKVEYAFMRSKNIRTALLQAKAEITKKL